MKTTREVHEQHSSLFFFFFFFFFLLLLNLSQGRVAAVQVLGRVSRRADCRCLAAPVVGANGDGSLPAARRRACGAHHLPGAADAGCDARCQSAPNPHSPQSPSLTVPKTQSPIVCSTNTHRPPFKSNFCLTINAGVRVPPAGNDPDVYRAAGEVFTTLKANNAATQLLEFPEQVAKVSHGSRSCLIKCLIA